MWRLLLLLLIMFTFSCGRDTLNNAKQFTKSFDKKFQVTELHYQTVNKELSNTLSNIPDDLKKEVLPLRKDLQQIHRKMEDISHIANNTLHNLDKLKKEGYCDDVFLFSYSTDIVAHYGNNPAKHNSIPIYCEDLAKAYYSSLSSELDTVNQQLKHIENKLKTIKHVAQHYQRYRDEVVKESKELIQIIDSHLNDMEKIYQTKVKQYNFNKDAITKAYESYKQQLESIKKQLQGYINNPASGIYCKYVKHCFPSKDDIDKIYRSFIRKFAELDEDYHVELLDRKLEYKMKLGLYIWDDSDDWAVTHSYYKVFTITDPHKIQILRQMIPAINSRDGYVCRVYFSWGKWYVRCFSNFFNPYAYELIKLSTYNYDDSGEIYVEDLWPSYLHHYRVVKIINGKPIRVEDKWVEVDEDEWNAYSSSMITFAKPIGYFMDQGTANPKQIYERYAHNPYYAGLMHNSHHNSGPSFWETYGQYALLRDLLFGNRDKYVVINRHYDYSDFKERWEESFYKGRPKPSYYGGRFRSLRGASSRFRGGSFGGGGK